MRHVGMFTFRAIVAMCTIVLATSCKSGGSDDDVQVDEDAAFRVVDGGFQCISVDGQACVGDVHYQCGLEDEFIRVTSEDCSATGRICVPDFWCVACRPNEAGCFEGNAARCLPDGSAWEVTDECELEAGEVCRDGQCVNLCDIAINERSYAGCEFYAADLDNASIAQGRDASAQQYAVVVSNPGQVETEVVVEINEAPWGEPLDITEIERRTVLPGDLEVFALPRREVDGASSNAECTPADQTCPGSETCVCSTSLGGQPVSPCFCRVSEDSDGLNDGTHSAVTSQAFRIRSVLPIIAYQFNPLDNVGVFSNDASLLLPTSALGRRYTALGWPQTIADGSLIDRDFDPNSDDEDLRSTLTILGTQEATSVTITTGPRVYETVPAGPIPQVAGGETFTIDVGPFDVINIETSGLNADFTGTIIEATHPVTVFTGSEASDVPRFETYATRQCCADHLEEQLFADETHGSTFIIARMPRRTAALNRAFVDPTVDSVGEFNEPEWVRVVATLNDTTVFTTLPAPDDRFTLSRNESIILKAEQDFIIRTESGLPLAVMQALPSQEAVGIPPEYPGGDPAIVVVPPVEQLRQDYVFLTPDQYAFDFVTITAEYGTNVLLDGRPLSEYDGIPLGEPRCELNAPADGIPRSDRDPPPDHVIHRCQLSFPVVFGLPNVRVEEGDQNDGVHTVLADSPVGIVVYGFDAYVSYAYAAGLNLKEIVR